MKVAVDAFGEQYFFPVFVFFFVMLITGLFVVVALIMVFFQVRVALVIAVSDVD